MDFAENFLCKWQNEEQSAHWGYNQVTIHPCVMYYKCPNLNCSEQVTDSLIFLSDDLVHDAHAVKIIQEQTKWHVQSTVNRLQKAVIISDGCAAQHKPSPFPWSGQGVTLERRYFGGRHGKSACDAVGGGGGSKD